jgi:hypothetical protein
MAIRPYEIVGRAWRGPRRARAAAKILGFSRRKKNFKFLSFYFQKGVDI